MANSKQADAPDALNKILDVCTRQEAAELKTLYNAQIQTLKTYQSEPTAQRKKDWDAAKGGYEEAERRLWTKYFGENEAEDAEPDPNAHETLIVTTTTACNFFQVARKTLAEWRKNGCPQISRGKWDLKAVFDWWWENLASDRAAQQGSDESMNEAKRLYWWEKAKGEQLKNDQNRGQLVPRDRIAREWAWRVAEVANGLSAMAKRLPPLLEGKSQSAMLQIIEDEVWKMRDNFTRTGQFCPQDAAQQALEESGEPKPKKQTQGGKKKSSGAGQKTRNTASTGQSRYGKTTSTRGKGKKGSGKK